MSAREFLAELPELAAAVADGAIDVRYRVEPLARIAEFWNAPVADRIVFTP